jgi:hypothetical protein
MYCPECGAEFREGIEKCADCDVPLVSEPPPELDVPEYVTILETSDLSVIPVLKSALEGAGIPYETRGEGLMDLFPSEALGAPFRSSAGEVEIRVSKDRADEARELLETAATVEEGAEGEAEEAEAAS